MSATAHPAHSPRTVLAAVAVAALLLVGCTGSDGSDTPESAPTTSPSNGPSTSDEPSPSGTAGSEAPETTPEQPESETELPDDDPTQDVPFPADLRPDTGQASDDARLSPTRFRVGVHYGFDRAVVDFSGSGTPGWRAQYTDAPKAQGSGRPVELLGNTAMSIEIDGVVLPTEEGAEPWSGPDNLSGQATGTVMQVHRGPLFEGVQEVFLGLTERRPFRVFSLENPTRLVIDVYHPDLAGAEDALPGDDPTAALPFPANRAPDTQSTSGNPRLSPVDMRFGVHDGFDRLVLDLTGPGTPGWRGEYIGSPTLAGSGAPVQLEGDADLRVSITGAVYPTERGAESYDGPQRFQSERGGNIREVVYGAIFEGQLDIYVGLESEQPFRVFQLEDPTRVVVDVQHP